jgi:plastocyanin
MGLALLLACSNNPTDSRVRSPLAPTALTGAAASNTSNGVLGTSSRDVIVNINDACDPDTFNAELGEGACVRNGGMTFQQFIAQLTRLTFVGPWHFAPNNANARPGDSFLVTNRGGETHTFTEVEEFGGGIVPDLNKLARLPEVAPECLVLVPTDFIAAGATVTEDIEEGGVERYQCCIHPWMRLTVNVRESHSQH